MSTKIRLVLLFGSIYQQFTFFANSYLFYLVLLLKITLFNTVHWKKSHDIVIKMLRLTSYEWKKLELTPLFETILWAKAGPNRASIDSSEKRFMLDYQLTVLLVKVVRTTFSEILSQYKTYT